MGAEDAVGGRAKMIAPYDSHNIEYVSSLVALAEHGLPNAYDRNRSSFAHTVRRVRRAVLRREGSNLRYASIVALGAAQLPEPRQRVLLAGASAREFVLNLVESADKTVDSGATALTAWAIAETRAPTQPNLVDRLIRRVKDAEPVSTVEHAWTLTALLKNDERDAGIAADQSAERLMSAQGSTGLFPHALPRGTLGRLRAHVSCFADQIYPDPSTDALCLRDRRPPRAGRGEPVCPSHRRTTGPFRPMVVALRRANGRRGREYPVYSVHQHAMAPMALLELAEAGGDDHRAAVASGLNWLRAHPEAPEGLVDADAGVIWRNRSTRSSKAGPSGSHRGDRSVPTVALGSTGPHFSGRSDRLRVPPLRIGVAPVRLARTVTDHQALTQRRGR